MRISDWSSDVCSSDLRCLPSPTIRYLSPEDKGLWGGWQADDIWADSGSVCAADHVAIVQPGTRDRPRPCRGRYHCRQRAEPYAPPRLYGNHQGPARSEEHTSELQSLMRTSYA